MAQQIILYHDKLKEIRRYLVQKGQARYKGTVRQTKLAEAEAVITQVYDLEKETNLNIAKQLIPDEVIGVIQVYLTKINQLYEDIINLCADKEEKHKMESFELKTAVHLIPVMDSTENTTKRMISNIELYETMLDNPGKTLLINFVLKSRLTESAKLRMKSTYTSVGDLVKDLRQHFITVKSYTSLHTQLVKCTQNRKTIDDFGNELEKLFTDLTISQAEGEPTTYGVLLPLNEKLAV